MIFFSHRKSSCYRINQKSPQKFDKFKKYTIIYLYLYLDRTTKMTKEMKQRLFYKKESDRTPTEKLVRDVVCYGVVIYAAVLGFLLVNANVNLANAQAELISNQIAIAQHVN